MIVTRQNKGKILTHAELDNNFAELETSITTSLNEAKAYADQVTGSELSEAPADGKEYVRKDTAWVETLGEQSELEKITEGANTGHRLLGADPANRGDIGNKAIDLTYTYSASTTLGATGFTSFAIGQETTASGMYAVAAGWDAIASGLTSFSYGRNTVASADYSIALGSDAVSNGESSIAIGENSSTAVAAYGGCAIGLEVHAINQGSSVFGQYNVGTSLQTAHEIGIGTFGANANGFEVYANGRVRAPEQTIALIDTDTDGLDTGLSARTLTTREYVTSKLSTASELQRLDEGNGNGWRLVTSNPLNYGNIGLHSIDLSFSDGWGVGATGNYAHAEGLNTNAEGNYSHAEGERTFASALTAHAEGYWTAAYADFSHAEGWNTYIAPLALYSHAEGKATSIGAGAEAAHVEGENTRAINNAQHVQGKWNIGTSTTTIHETGIGTSDVARANAFEIHTDGKIVMPHLPTSDPLMAGALWNNAGVLNISAG